MYRLTWILNKYMFENCFFLSKTIVCVLFFIFIFISVIFHALSLCRPRSRCHVSFTSSLSPHQTTNIEVIIVAVHYWFCTNNIYIWNGIIYTHVFVDECILHTLLRWTNSTQPHRIVVIHEATQLENDLCSTIYATLIQ